MVRVTLWQYSEYYLGPEDTVSYPGYLHCLDFISPGSIYYGGTVNYWWSSEFAEVPSYYILGKFNADLTLSWQKYYGGDKYYNLWALTASTDGGCLLIRNSRQRINTQSLAPGIYYWQIVYNNTVIESGKWIKL